MSYNGPSGRGEKSASQPPHRIRASDRALANSATSEVLPIPASPLMSTVQPWPARAAASASPSEWSADSRSRSFTGSCTRASDRDRKSVVLGKSVDVGGGRLTNKRKRIEEDV